MTYDHGTIGKILVWVYVGGFILISIICGLADCVKHHRACRPERKE